MTGLAGFLLGFIGTAPLAAPFIAKGYAREHFVGGLAQFLAIVLGAGTLFGIVGLRFGVTLGSMWERRHRQHRRYQPEDYSYEEPAPMAPIVAPTPAFPAGSSRRARDWSIRYETGGIEPAAFLTLAQRVWPREYDEPRVASALGITTNTGAWDEGRLVGVVRVLTDGYLFATVPEILVDPEYRNRGIGAELMRRALESSPRGALFLGARLESAGFFERVGAERGPTGFTMRAKTPRS
ncbi:MAG: GNAT family N-acetyltransferase [Gemmatimonadota bacterium]|nr:GNAT family N-acetyltransferase [Gemmatimonadota bacterium]